MPCIEGRSFPRISCEAVPTFSGYWTLRVRVSGVSVCPSVASSWCACLSPRLLFKRRSEEDAMKLSLGASSGGEVDFNSVASPTPAGGEIGVKFKQNLKLIIVRSRSQPSPRTVFITERSGAAHRARLHYGAPGPHHEHAHARARMDARNCTAPAAHRDSHARSLRTPPRT